MDKVEDEKLKWMKECDKYRKMIDEQRRNKICDLTKENDDLRDELAESYLIYTT